MIVVIGSLTFRVYSQATASLPSSPPATWVYDLATRLTAPFERYETGPAISGSPSIDIPALVALDIYLFAGCALLFLTWLARSAVYLSNRPFVVLRTRAVVTKRLLPAGARVYRRADAWACGVFVAAFAATRLIFVRVATNVRDLGWADYRRHIERSLEQAKLLGVHGVIVAARAAHHAVIDTSLGARRSLHGNANGARFGQAKTTAWTRGTLRGIQHLDASAFAGLSRAAFVPPPRSTAWLAGQALTSAERGRHKVAAWSALGRGPDLLSRAWKRAAVAAGGLSRSQLARGTGNGAWLSGRAINSALSDRRRLSAYRVQRTRRSPFAASTHPGRRISRRSFLRLPASHV
jgi:hypothetical protein